MGAYRDLTWQASSSCEKTHIVEVMGRVDVQISQNIAIASDIVGRDNIFGRRFGPRAGKVRGCAHFVMVARITRMKNQLAAIEMLGKLRGQVSLELIGPVDDQAYWQKCAAAAKALPSNATVVYRGPLPPGQVSDALEANEFFVLPTRGENFGHAIFEALACSLPVLLSDTTSWPLLQDHGAGWTIPLANESAWIARMQACVDMAGDEYEGLVASTGAFAVGFAKADAAIEQNIRLFRGDL
jgi:glycosyltransferase involved in cell wall biosynthesis